MKKNTKRFLCALLSGVMMLGLLTACGGSDSGSETGGEESTGSKELTV